MGCRAAGDHADEVTGRNGVGGGTAKTLAGILALDSALGSGRRQGPMAQFLQQVPWMPILQGFMLGPVKTVSMPSSERARSFAGCDINGSRNRIGQFFGLFFFFFFFCH
jgi:hypothetical protein